MLTSLTNNLGFWIIFATVLISIGTYKLLTKQNMESNARNSEEIKEIGSKIDSFSMQIKLEQVKMQSNLENLNEKTNRIENDTTMIRAQSNLFSDSIARMQVRLQNLEKGENHANS